MSLFDQLVDRVLENQAGLAPLRPAVEKELLHHDILREMSGAGLLASLTFIGGTCLRLCYGSNRLSEDLDFTAGSDFNRKTLANLGPCIVQGIQNKYGLTALVTEPVKESGSVDTWKIKVITHPERKDLPVQKVNIDICTVPSYERKPMLLRQRYDVDMGTSGLIIQSQSREEILADKILSLALRPNRIKQRDLWDIAWLKQQNVTLLLSLIPKKIADHQRDTGEFLALLKECTTKLVDNPESHQHFTHEMRRFLPSKTITETVNQPGFWDYLTELIRVEVKAVQNSLNRPRNHTAFSLH